MGFKVPIRQKKIFVLIETIHEMLQEYVLQFLISHFVAVVFQFL